jgi:hypothetical protein
MTFEVAPQPQAEQPQRENRGILTILLIILAVVVFIGLIVCLCLLAPFILALLGPAIGNVFSNIVLNI